MKVILSRHDGPRHLPFDSIAWAFSEHVGQTDQGEFNFAILDGNEDAPERIEFWRSHGPRYDEEPDFTWEA